MLESFKFGDHIYCSKRETYGTVTNISDECIDVEDMDGRTWFSIPYFLMRISAEEYEAAEVLDA